MARKRLGPDRQPWKGTYANEHLYNSVHNALVGIILDGVTGVSPNIGHHQIAPEKADEYLDRGRRVLTDFESQNIAPGGANGKTQRWMNHKIDELRRLVTDAEDVRSGKKPQKMTPADYEALRTHRPWTGLGEQQRVRAPRVKERHALTGPSVDNVYQYRGASIELNSLGTRKWWATVRFRSEEIDFEATSSDEALEKAKDWIDNAPEFKGRYTPAPDDYGRPYPRETKTQGPHRRPDTTTRRRSR